MAILKPKLLILMRYAELSKLVNTDFFKSNFEDASFFEDKDRLVACAIATKKLIKKTLESPDLSDNQKGAALLLCHRLQQQLIDLARSI